MPRLAWFSPMPPDRSGIAAYSAELLPRLQSHAAIDVYTERPGAGSLDAHEFLWRHNLRPYDLIVYQVGNATCHDYMWPYLTRFPGLVVLHDGQLHHARAMQLIRARLFDDYRAEFRFCHPEAPTDAAELVIAAGGGSLLYVWPMVGVVVRSARLVAVHAPWLASDLRDRFPGVPVETIRMGVADPWPSDGRRIRERLALEPDAIVFAAFGKVTPEKRIAHAVRALAAITPHAPSSHLLLVGETVPYYDPMADARRWGVERRVHVAGHVDDSELADYLAAADVCLCLRWPTTRETSASWLRSLAAGKPTIVTDLVHAAEVLSLDPRTWTVLEASAAHDAAALAKGAQPVCVSIDIMDEDHSLALAMRRLATDGELRAVLGMRARAHWAQTHTLEAMADDYARMIGRALEAPMPDLSLLPTHLREDGFGLARRLLAEMSVPRERLDGLLP